ncbi:CopG family ribbon-helix-helix protein [Haloimpatiens sp. FM7315]|uniref:CopG family ribbon-helix-helix protein n=1 Tax=Haloimpatiens sp. FM7315 TaxID=3298609 RepID=UPI00370A6179
MSDSKRLVVNLSKKLFSEFDDDLRKDSKKRSEFIREAIILYIEEKKRLSLEKMKNGYLEMAEINLELCEYGFQKDVKELREYEAMLSESDLPDGTDSKKRRYILC